MNGRRILAGAALAAATLAGAGCHPATRPALPPALHASPAPRTVDVAAAEHAATDRLATLGDGWECWPEINSQQPDGYEVICNHWAAGDTPQPATFSN